MLTVQDVNLNDIGEAQWTELTRQSCCASFFQTFIWIKLWLSHFGDSIERSLILAVYDNGVIVGIGPFAIQSNTIQFLTLSEVNNEHTLSDFGDVIAVTSKEEIVWLALINHIKQLSESENYAIKLTNIRGNSVGYNLIIEQNYLNLEQIEVAPKIKLPKDWQSYLSTLSSHYRYELKRKLKTIVEQQLSVSKVIINPETINEYIRLIDASNQEKQNFYSASIRNFFIDLLYQPPVDLFFLYHNNVAVSSLITFNYKDDVMAYNTSYDLRFNHLSPGILLFGLVIQQAITKQKQWFDFLRGSEPYKYRLGALDQRLFCAHHGIGV